MIALKLAARNLLGAGLRTWLNAAVLSIAFFVIIWHKGLLDGWHRQARRDTIDWEIGGGQFWHPAYDPYDAFTLAAAHGPLPAPLRTRMADGSGTAVLVAPATIYPHGRMRTVVLRGIDPGQTVLRLPTAALTTAGDEVPALIGTRMARDNRLQAGDVFDLRWRDAHGTFDAASLRVAGLFKTSVPGVDAGQIWLPLDRLRRMLRMPGEATLFVLAGDAAANVAAGRPGWAFKDHSALLADLDEMIRRKSIGGLILYALLLSLAMLAVFDTQVLSVFRRRKEIGTIIALGMTRGQVVGLFTLEGAGQSLLAALLAAVYGLPFLSFQAVRGFSLPQATDEYGFAAAGRIFPFYSLGLVVGTTVLVMAAATIVSFLPARRIARLKPTDAIRGKTQ